MRDIANGSIPVVKGYFKNKKESKGLLPRYHKKCTGYVLTAGIILLSVGALASSIKDL